jgi:hypothetical protein
VPHALDVVVGVELIHELAATAVLHPGIHLAGGQAKGHSAAKSENVVFAGEVIRGGQGHIDDAILHTIDHFKSGHQLTSGVQRNFKFAAGHIFQRLGKFFATAKNGIQRFRKAGGQTPAHRSLRLHCGGHTSGQNASDTCLLNQGTTIHSISLVFDWNQRASAVRSAKALCSIPQPTRLSNQSWYQLHPEDHTKCYVPHSNSGNP